MIRETGEVEKTWLEAGQLIKEEKWEELEEKLDYGILCLAFITEQGLGDKDIWESVKMETWKERFWISVEKYIWVRREDYETNWKCS